MWQLSHPKDIELESATLIHFLKTGRAGSSLYSPLSVMSEWPEWRDGAGITGVTSVTCALQQKFCTGWHHIVKRLWTCCGLRPYLLLGLSPTWDYRFSKPSQCFLPASLGCIHGVLQGQPLPDFQFHVSLNVRDSGIDYLQWMYGVFVYV